MAIERQVAIHTMNREHVVFDSRFVPPPKQLVNAKILYFVTQGSMQWYAPSNIRCDAGGALAMSWEDWDGGDSRRPFAFQSWGAPFRAVEIRLMVPHVSHGPAVLRCSDATLKAVDDYATFVLGKPAHREAALYAKKFIEHLEGEHLVPSGIAASMKIEEDVGIMRAWEQLASRYARFDAQPSIKPEASAAGLSIRQISRLILMLQRDFPIVSRGWREFTFEFRIKMAVQYLSIDDAPIADVARAVGYQHAEAMTNAFKKAGQPAPRAIRAAIMEGRVAREQHGAARPLSSS